MDRVENRLVQSVPHGSSVKSPTGPVRSGRGVTRRTEVWSRSCKGSSRTEKEDLVKSLVVEGM